MKRVIVIILTLIFALPLASAQNERRSVRSGNHDFRKGKYQQAEIDYKKALIADSLSNAASYNLGNTYYKMEDYAQASKSFDAVADSLAKDPKNGASLYHNMGNALLQQKNYQGAIEAYKNALRRNPSDMDTKANLSYAKKMLENQQQNQDQNQQNQDQNQQNQDQNQNQNQDQQQDQNKDQNKDQNQDKNQNQDQNQDQQDQPQGQQPQEQPKISQKDAQQMLQAIQDKEDETQEKVKKEKALMMQSKQKEKNW